MQTELNTYIILIVTSVIMTAFFAIRRRIKKVIFLIVIIIILGARAGSIHTAIEYAKDYADKTGISLEQDENGIPTGISMEFPKLDFSEFDILPEASYYSIESEEENN